MKVSGQMRSDAFKSRLAFSFTLRNNFGLKLLFTTTKTFHYYGTGV